jgi:predicted nucleic acid-binding protein
MLTATISGRNTAAPNVNAPTVLLDTNILLDVALERVPWASEAALLLDAIERGRAKGFVAGHAITTLYYVISRSRDRRTAATAVSDVLRLLPVVALETADFHHALVLGLGDFEDAVQVSAALKVGADFLVTRNPNDFAGAPIAVRSAGEVFASL